MKVCFVVFGFCLLIFASCTGSFTPEELEIINDGTGVMRILKTNKYEDSLLLRQNARSLSGNDLKVAIYEKLKERMLLTVMDSTDPGVGIAAPQIGIGRRLIAVQRSDKEGEPFEFYVNPAIDYYSEAQGFGSEGCLSVPEVIDSVWRSKEIIISYMPEPVREVSSTKFKIGFRVGIEYKKDWIRKKDTLRGFPAVIFQHEMDHLEGILFTDRIRK